MLLPGAAALGKQQHLPTGIHLEMKSQAEAVRTNGQVFRPNGGFYVSFKIWEAHKNNNSWQTGDYQQHFGAGQ